MSNAWEVTPDDIASALEELNIIPYDSRVEECFNAIDTDAVEDAVLYYTDFDDQCAAAHIEIVTQLKEYFA